MIDEALARLRAAADGLAAGWSPDGVDGLAALDLDAGTPQTLRLRLEPPAALHGVPLADDRLELTVTSIYPIEVAVDGEVVLAEPVPPVAAGPALVEVMKAIRPGATADLAVTVRPIPGQGGSWPDRWLRLRFTTPRLRARFEELDLAWARLALANQLATTATERATVAAAARLVTATTMDLTGLADTLTPVSERAAAIEVHVIGHAHIDLAWLWTWDDAREVIKRDVRSMLAIMRDFPEVTFTHSQPAGYEVIRQEEPELFAELVDRVREGRWEPATAQWVETDANLAAGEAMASQLLEGVAFSRTHLGVEPRVCLAPDTFGHSANLPQLLAEAGVQVYYHHRANPGIPERWPAYWWEGIDGTRVLACSTKSYLGALTPGAVAAAAIEAAQAGLPAALLFVGVGDHGGGPTRQGYDVLRRIGTAPGMPTARCSTLAIYAERLRSAGVRLPVHRGESATIFEGCYTTHADAKQANRDGENRLLTAEAVAALAGLPRDPALTEAWRDLCFHQFHDILGGSAIAEVYEQTRDDHARVVRVTERVISRGLARLAAAAPAGTVTVVNPLGHDRTDLVVVPGVPDGTVRLGQPSDEGLLFVARVPGFGVAQYRLDDPDPATGSVSVAEDDRYVWVETPHFRVAVRRDCGVLTSFVDKRVERELVAFGMRRATDYGDTARPDLGLNVFQLVEERPHFMSAWQHHEVRAEHSLVDGAQTEVVERGPVRVLVRVTHRLRGSRVVEDIAFYRDLPRLDFTVRLDWHEPGGPEHGVPNLKLAFTPDLDQCQPWFEVPHGAVRRRSSGQQVPALRWVDVGGPDYGVAVLNDATYGHDVLGNRVRLSLVRTAYVPDPCSDRGAYTFRCSLLPHAGDWRDAAVPHAAAGFNQPLLAHVGRETDTAGAPGWRPRIDASGGLVTAALRVARDGSGTVLRLAEASGRQARVTVAGLPDRARVWVSDLIERRHRPAGTMVELRPFQVKTLLIEQE